VIALAASILVALYLLIPSSLFRLFFGLYVPLRNFVRTRGEEILQGVLSTLLPVALALILVWTVPPFNKQPFSLSDTAQIRRADYKLVFSALYSEDIFKQSGDMFWKALTRTGRRQARFLVWYYLFIAMEGLGMGKLSVSYADFADNRWYKWAAKNILLSNISEWHLLLTTFFFSDKRTVVRADIMCSDNTLYRGIVVEHSSDRGGQLVGVILSGAKRYRRTDYLEDKKKGPVKTEDYWRPIPGTKLYMMADKILNLNLTYEGPEPPPTKLMEEVISRQLKQPISIVLDQTQIPPQPES
jgi:hypothetical protein